VEGSLNGKERNANVAGTPVNRRSTTSRGPTRTFLRKKKNRRGHRYRSSRQPLKEGEKLVGQSKTIRPLELSNAVYRRSRRRRDGKRLLLKALLAGVRGAARGGLLRGADDRRAKEKKGRFSSLSLGSCNVGTLDELNSGARTPGGARQRQK